ncbi:hypothetical protein NEOLI_001769 [Neolecta irregularis DAH-3]|uniref:Uncharacterized protein n=1 Tax=Neolecta irregularis (strain DAH-3) TaxID=1198029 RepID=A0A1U7LIP7_NEOID|nr:hypothetical protein NEOLI_001769 [Neolecta irregularis DAH-3]|eukprot:OLL22422.1 hypothetical protein NEOLI_001769 [Neolecta irregularis DAH-3]
MLRNRLNALSGSLYEGSYRTRAVPYERENVGDEMAEDEISEPPVSDYATITASEKRFCQDNIFCGDVSNEALIEESALNIPFIQSSTDPTTSDDTFRLQDLTVINNLSFVREADTDIDQIAQEQGQVLMNNVENMQSTSPRSLRIRKKRNWSETEEDSSPIKSSNETSLLKPGGPPRDAVTDFSASKEPSTPTNRGRRRSNGTVRERSNRKGGSKESKTAVKSCPIAEDRPVTPDDIKRSHLEIDGTELLAPEIRAGHLLRNGKDRDITPLSATVGFHHKLFPDHEHGRSKKK